MSLIYEKLEKVLGKTKENYVIQESEEKAFKQLLEWKIVIVKGDDISFNLIRKLKLINIKFLVFSINESNGYWYFEINN
jgi:hypothetical protein